MSKPRRPIIVSDDIPAEYLRRLLGRRINRETVVFSRSDALREAEAESPRTQTSGQQQPHGRPHRGQAGG